MNIAIVGYGRMGRMVMESARGMGIGVSSVIDPFSDDKEVTGRSLSDIPLSRVDAVIDFSASESVLENIEYYASSGIAAVIGTTGWYDRLDAIKYGLKFRPLFYRKSYPHNEKCLYDISFIGWMHSERYQLLHLLKKQFQRHGISYKFVLYTSRYSYFINRYVKGAIKKEDSDFFVFKPISYEDYIKISYASKVILDLAHPLQSGLTMRTIEAIGMKKKILTNNTDILNYSSLNSNNYFVFEKPNLFIDYSLFSNKYVETNNSYFSLESFVNELVQNLER